MPRNNIIDIVQYVTSVAETLLPAPAAIAYVTHCAPYVLSVALLSLRICSACIGLLKVFSLKL